MKKLRLFLAVAIVCIGIIAFALTGQTRHFFVSSSSQTAPIARIAPKQESQRVNRTRSALPEHVSYFFLFNHLANIANTSAAANFQAKSGLNERQFAALVNIALDNKRETAALDQQARVISDAFRQQYPPGKLPPGVIPPAPPAELNVLQRQREATILRHRDLLRAALGSEAFNRFNDFVRNETSTNTSTSQTQAAAR